MTKTKKSLRKKSGQADNVTSVKTREKTLNPFELHFNKQKHSVLGQRFPGEVGKPGISKAKALKKRKLTLQRELNTRTKTNEFVDRRIGEKSKGMSAEDRLAARFAAERKKQHRQALFNLEEPSELTHMGQTLSEIEKYEDPRSDDEDDDALGADFVKAAHFGGGLLEKSGPAAHSRKEWIDEMIAESKLRKYEARRARDETMEMTDKLDDDYRDVLQLVRDAKMFRPTRACEAAAAADAASRKTEPAIASSAPVTSGITSAAASVAGGSTAAAASVAGGSTAAAASVAGGSTAAAALVAGGSTAAAASVAGGSTAADPDEEYDALVRQLNFAPRVGQASDRTKADAEVERERTQRLRLLEEARILRMRADPDDAVMPAAHRSADDLDDGMVLDAEPERRLQLVGDQLIVTSPAATVTSEVTSRAARRAAARVQKQQQPDEDEEATDQQPNAAVKLPNYRELAAELRQLPPLQQLQRVTSLAGQLSAAQQVRLYGQLVRYTVDSCRRAGTGLRAADALVPALYQMTQRLGDAACRVWLDWLARCWQRRQRRRTTYPGLEVLVPLRVCGQLFPASDRRHPATMPAMLLLAQMVSECRVRSRRQLSAGLLAASLLTEMTSLSGRLLPELVTFLHGVLCSALPADRRPKHQPQLLSGHAAGLLQLASSCAGVEYDRRLALSAAHSDAPPDDSWRLSCLHVAVALVQQLAQRLAALSAAHELLAPLVEPLASADLRPLPHPLRAQWTAALVSLRAVTSEKTSLEKVKRRPKPLRLYEPAIEEHWDGGRKRTGSAARREHDKLVHKYKRQLRSTVREVRRDNAFLARAKLDHVKARDDERRRKLNTLMSALQTQEGDYKRMKRQK